MLMTAAQIGPAHGLRGEVIVDIRSDDPQLFTPGESFSTSNSDFPALTLSSIRQQKDRVIALFDEVSSREDAEALRGARLLVDEREEEDAWYPHQLKGLRAQDPQGRPLGSVSGLRPGGAQDLLLVGTERGEVMVPFVRQLVPTVDVEGGRVVINPPPGLFDDGADDSGRGA